ARLHSLLADPELYRSGTSELEPSQAVVRLEEVEKELEQAYERWEFLDSIPR
ncbi:MAG: hypothetical protein ACLFMZ_01670, partial [Spirochaetaceae bacterium]